MTPPIPLRSDSTPRTINGENWALIGNASDPSPVRVGAVVIAGMPRFWSIVRITAVDSDGQESWVRFVQLDEGDPAARELLATVA